jgi:hypothetical protein
MSDIITNLEDLGPEELKAVSNLINKLAKRKKQSESTEEVVDSTPLGDTVREQKPKGPPKRHSQGRTEPRNPQNKKTRVKRKGGRGRGGAGRTESVVLSNENKFERMRERNDFKKDTEIDKKLWSGREPTQRPDEFQFVEVQCKECGRWYDINPDLVYVDQDSREINFTCDDCVPRGN